MSYLLFFYSFFFLFPGSLSLYSSSSKVKGLTSQNFHNTVIKAKNVWFIEFYSPGCPHCRNLVPEYEKLANALDGIVNIGAVDTQAENSLGSQYNVRGVPSLKLFLSDKTSPIDYNGARSANEMMNFIFQQMKNVAQSRMGGKKDEEGKKKNQSGNKDTSKEVVIELTDDNFDSLVLKDDEAWFIEFFAPWCGHCKQLQPEWAKLPRLLAGVSVKIGKVDATVQQKIASRFQIQGYPTIKFFGAGKKQDSKAEDYRGGRDTDSMVQFINSKVGVKAKEIVQLTGEEIYQKYCGDKKNVCIIAFLPHILDSSPSERNSYLSLLSQTAKKHQSSPLQFLWTQAGDQIPLEEQLALGGGFPTAVTLNTGRGVYSVMRGAFAKDNLEKWLEEMMKGRGVAGKLNGDIKIMKAEKWSIKDEL